MAIKGAWTNAFLRIGSVDLSDHLVELVFAEADDAVDVTAHGSAAVTMKPSGIPSWSGSAQFHQDFAAGSVHQTFQGIAGSTAAAMALVFRESTAAAGATNEQMTGTLILTEYNGFQGSVRDNAVADITFVSGGAITASTST